MANSRSSPPAEGGERTPPTRLAPKDDPPGPTTPLAAHPVVAAVHRALAAFAKLRSVPADGAGLCVAVALSGGRDSMALLDALAILRAETGFTLCALHVHHGLSPNADRWAAFCAEECRQRNVELTVERVQVRRLPSKSLEATARTARYSVFRRSSADVLLLAHHADDQAETLLLQLLRGAGPSGLAAMPAAHAGTGPALLRPWLSMPRAMLEAFVGERSVRFIDDESNADTAIKRNYLREEIAPRLAAAFPGYPGTLVRAAAHNAEAAHLMDELAAIDSREICAAGEDGALTIDRAALIALGGRTPARARNLLRWFLRTHGLPLPSTARLGAMLDQLLHAAGDACVRLPHAGAELGIFRGSIVVHAVAPGRFAAEWSGEASLALPHGILEFMPVQGEGIAAAKLAANKVTVRQRIGGERMRLGEHRGSRTVKRLLHDAGIAPWLRSSLPFVYCGDELAAIANLGVDAAFRAADGTPGMVVRWHPESA